MSTLYLGMRICRASFILLVLVSSIRGHISVSDFQILFFNRCMLIYAWKDNLTAVLTICIPNLFCGLEYSCHHNTGNHQCIVDLRNINLPLMLAGSMDYPNPWKAAKLLGLRDDGKCSGYHCLTCNDGSSNCHNKSWPI